MKNPSSWEDPPEDEEPEVEEELDFDPEDIAWGPPTHAPYRPLLQDPVDYVYDPFNKPVRSDK